jgi:hypothetical protein
MATDPFDFKVDSSVYSGEIGADFESPFVPERSTFSDFFHGLWAGIGETADIFGRGIDSDSLRGVGEYIKDTSYAKPDISEYLGVQSRRSKVATGTGQGLPLSAPFMAGGAAGVLGGGLAGPVGATAGGIAGTSAVGAAFAKGLYDKTYEEVSLANPEMSEEDVDAYAKKYVAIETLTELADTGVSLVAGKVAGKLTGNAVKAGLKTGLLSLDDIIGASAKRIGAKQMAGAILGDMAISGGSEVLAENLQYKLDQEYDIDSEVPDYLTTFLIGAAISGPLGGSAVISEKRTQDKIKQNIETGLNHEDIDVRKNMALQVSENLGKVSPEAQGLWDDYVSVQLEKGPLSLTDPDLLISTTKVDKLKSEKNIENLEKLGIINRLDRVKRAVEPKLEDIIEKPEEILKEAGIPTSPVGAIMSPYGKGIAPPGVSSAVAPPVVEPAELYNKSGIEPQWKQDLPLSQKETNALMDEQVTAYQEGGKLPPSKITTVPTKEKVKAKAEPERKATDLTAQWKKPIYDNAVKIEEAMAELPEDSNTITAEELQKTEEAKKTTRLQALKDKLYTQGKLDLTEAKEIKDLMGVTRIGDIRKAVKAEKETVKTEDIEKKVDPTLLEEQKDLEATIADSLASTDERKAALSKLNEVKGKISEQASAGIIGRGKISGVTKEGKKTVVTYDEANWVPRKENGAIIYANDNAILYKTGKKIDGNEQYALIQVDEEGNQVKHKGTYKSLKAGKAALAEGKLPVTPLMAKKQEAVKTMTAEQKASLATIPQKETIAKAIKVAGGDVAAHQGDALDGILEAVSTYDPEKASGKTLQAHALSTAINFVKRAKNKKNVEVSDTAKTNEDGTEATSLSDASNAVSAAELGDVKDETEVKRTRRTSEEVKAEKEAKAAEVPPIKSLKEVLDKHKVPAELRGQYFLDVSDGKKTFESIDKELNSKAKVEPLESDVITRPKAEVDARKAAVTKTATDILKRVDWDKAKAIATAQSAIKDEAATLKVILEIGNLTENTAASILDRYVTNTEVPVEYKGLAGFLKKLLKDNPDKLNSISIRVDPEAASASYDPNTHTVTLTRINTIEPTPLHEIAHAITVRELYSNPELRQEVLDLMKLVEAAAIERGIISQENVDKVKALQKRTGQEFKQALTNDDTLTAQERVILYALNNEFEFMAQPFNNKSFSQFLTSVEIPTTHKKAPTTLKSAIKSIYDAVVDIVSRIFSKPNLSVSNNTMKRMLGLFTELAGQDVSLWTEGQKTYGEDVLEADTSETGKTSAEEHYRIMKEAEVSLTETPIAWVKKQADKIKDTIKDYGQSTFERLARISQPIANSLRKMEFNISTYNRDYSKRIKSFVDKYDKLNHKYKLLLDLYLMNADGTNEATIRRDKILKDNKMTEDFQAVKKVLQEIYLRRKVVGLNKTNDIEDYWPRRVKDIDAFRQAMKNDGSYGVIEAQIDRDGVNSTDREALITSLINTGRMPKLAFKVPTSAKERQIHIVKSEWKQFYMNTSETLVAHIYENNEAIESRAMFGTTKRKKNAELRDRLYKTLESKRPESKGYNRTVKKIVELEEWLKDVSDQEYKEGISEFLEKSLTNIEHNRKLKDLTAIEDELKTLKVGSSQYAKAMREKNKLQKWISANPINAEVVGIDFTPKEQSDLIKLLRGRLTQEGMHGTLAAIRNLSLMSVLGNPLSAITQLGDISFAINDAGVSNSLKAAFGDKVVSAKDLDLAHSLREFQNGKTAGWLDWSLRTFGMTAMDKFGKELYMNSVINKAKKESLDQFRNQWGKYLEKDTEQTYNDIKDGRPTQLVKLFAFNALSEVQPISMSEMPIKYLTAGNGRLLYALKSYNIKLLNNLYKRFSYNFKDAKTPKDKIKALRDASKLLVLVVIAGASADELKEFILGRGDVSSFSDKVTDNLLKMTLVSKFSLQKADREGFFKSMVAGNLIPPLQIVDDPIKDLKNLVDPEADATFYTLRNVPGGGKLAYSWLTDTAAKSEYSMIKQNIFDDYKDGSSYGELRKRINKYNAWARREDKPLITFATLRQAKKRSSVP